MEERDQLPAASSNIDSAGRPKRLPPISILDLLVLTTALALVFMILGRLVEGQPILARYAESTIWNVWRMLSAVLPGIAFAAVFWLAKQKRTTGRFMWQPGHWILAGYAVLQVLSLAAWSIISYAGENMSSNSKWIMPYLISLTLANLIAGTTMSVAVFCNPVRWRGVLAMVAISMVLEGMIYATSFEIAPLNMTLIMTIGYAKFVVDILCVLLLIVATIIDIRKKTRRDWLHWVGVFVLFLAIVVQPIAQFFLMRFMLAP